MPPRSDDLLPTSFACSVTSLAPSVANDDPEPLSLPEQFRIWHAEWLYADAVAVWRSWEQYAADCHVRYLEVLEENSRFRAADCTYFAKEELRARRKAAEFQALAIARASGRGDNRAG